MKQLSQCGLFAATLAASILGLSAFADEPSVVKLGNLKIEDAFVRPTPNGASVGAGYLKIINTGADADRLLSASSDISGKTEIHEMAMDNGVMKMRPLPNGLPIPAGATVTLQPGGYHIMFIDLKRPIKPGDIVHAELTFEKAGKSNVAFPAAASMDATSPDSGMGNMKMQ